MRSEDAKAMLLLNCAEICGGYHKDGTCKNCENDAAVNALDKQIPKKPIGDLHSVPHYRCPTCKCTVSMYNTQYDSFCKYCGQAIDWIGAWNEQEAEE